MSEKVVTDAGWEHTAITLIPMSANPGYQPIKLSMDALTRLTVIGVFEKVLEANISNEP
jgi:hypothetical protein